MRGNVAIAAILGLAALAGAREARAERVAVVLSAELPPYLKAGEGLGAALEGHEIFTHSLEGRQEKWPEVEAMLAREPADVVVTVGSLATALASRRLQDVPLVYTMVVNPEKLLEPGGCPVTGVSLDQDPERVFRRLLVSLPRVRRIGVLYDPAQSGPRVEEARVAAATLGLEMAAVEVGEARELPDALRRLLDRRPDVLWLLVDRTVLATHEGLELIMLETLRRGVPVVAPSERYTRAGALLASGTDYRHVGEQTGGLVAEILQPGASVTARPLPAPRRAEVVRWIVNEKVQEALGVEVQVVAPSEVLRAGP